MPRPLVFASYAGLAVVGAVVGFVGAFVQGSTVEALGVDLPVGVLAALAAAGSVFAVGRELTSSRAGAVVPGVAWLLTALYLSSTRAEGDVVLFASSVSAYVFLFGGMLLLGVVAGLP